MNRPPAYLTAVTHWPILVSVLVLSGLGVLSIYADDPSAGRRQIVFLGVALVCMFLFQAVNYQKLGRFAWPFYLLSLLLIGYTVAGAIIGGASPLPGVTRRNGAYNWIGLGPITLQPSELMKIAFVMVMARYLRFRSNYRRLGGLIPPFLLALVPIGLILKQPDLGTALVFVPILIGMLFVAGARLLHLVGVIGLGISLLPLVWLAGTDYPLFRHLPELVKPYQRERVYAMFRDDPGTLERTGFQQQHALIAFGSGGITGKGPARIPVGARVPEGHNDMIFALIGEQFGLVGSVVVIGGYMVLFLAGIEIASSTREPFGKLMAVGVVAALAGQAFLNLMVATKMMPVTGVTLPFISAGGSSLIASCMAAGLLLNIGQNRPMVIANDAFEY
jgi:cell division protein FtsW (lipid II flippase)